MNKQKGMTVIELLVTLMVFSVTIVVVLGLGTGRLHRSGLKNTSNELLGMVNYAKSKAAKENRPVAISFTSTTYREHFYEGGNWSPELDPEKSPSIGELASGTTLTNFSTIAFNSRGILVDPVTFLIKSSVKLTLATDQGDGIKIKVLSYGGVKVKNSWRHSSEYGSF